VKLNEEENRGKEGTREKMKGEEDVETRRQKREEEEKHIL
jgi:hypothetical protein